MSWEEEMCPVQKWPFEGISTPQLLTEILQWRQEVHCHGKQDLHHSWTVTDPHEIWHRQWLYFHCLTHSHRQQNLWTAVGSSQKQSSQNNGVEILISRDCTCFPGSLQEVFLCKDGPGYCWNQLHAKHSFSNVSVKISLDSRLSIQDFLFDLFWPLSSEKISLIHRPVSEFLFHANRKREVVNQNSLLKLSEFPYSHQVWDIHGKGTSYLET